MIRLYDRFGSWLKAIDWALPIMLAITVFNVSFFILTMDGCTLEPVSAQYSGDEM